MARGDGRGGNNGNSGNGDHSAHDIGPADVLLGRLILLAREGNRAAVREALDKITPAEIVLARAAQCVRKGAMQSAISVLGREFERVFGDSRGYSGQDGSCIRRPQAEAPKRGWSLLGEEVNTPLAALDLPLRVVNALEEHLGAITVFDLLKFTPQQVVAVPLLGANYYQKIRAALAKIGIEAAPLPPTAVASSKSCI